MNRRRLLGAAGASLLFAFKAGGETSRPKRIVWDGPGQGDAGKPARERVRGLFATRGLVEGRDYSIEFTAGPKGGLSESPSAFQAHLDRLVASRPDVLVVGVGGMSLRRTHGVPIVFRDTPTDPAKLGLVESLRRPGGNMTGSTLADEEMTLFIWKLLKQITPGLTRGGFLQDADDIRTKQQFFEAHDRGVWQPVYESYLEVRRLVESQLGIQTVEVRMRRDASSEEISTLVRKAGVQALQVVIIPPTDAVIAALKATRVPAVGILHASARQGLLMGISWDHSEGERYVVEAVVRILKGESPATIPVYRVRSWSFAINKATARAIGIEIPPSLLVAAAEVVE